MANSIIRIGEHTIGENKPVFMLAEIGLNHNGSVRIAKKLIDAASACNWHCVKFQKRTPELAVPEHQKNVMRDTPWGRIPYLEYRYKVEFDQPEYDIIDGYCKDKPILWSASVWDIPSLDFLETYKVPLLKVPSAKMTNMELLSAVAKTAIPVIVSTGMSTLEEVDEAVNCLEKYSKGNYVLMHTNSTYPTPNEDINLRVIQLLRERYRCVVGYSGHEYDLEPSVVAVVLGARVIERHITLDHNMWGSDHFASLEVHAADMLYKRIKNIDAVIGDGIKRVTEKELEVRKKLRG